MTITTIALLCALPVVALCGACVALAFRARAENRTLAGRVEILEGGLTELSRDLDAASERASDYARRIAWLESRARPVKQIEAVPNAESAAPAKMTITERRHRVITLARRGQDAETIAATLNMPHGEVALIIGLNKAA